MADDDDNHDEKLSRKIQYQITQIYSPHHDVSALLNELLEKYKGDCDKIGDINHMKRTWDRIGLEIWTMNHLIEDIEDWEESD